MVKARNWKDAVFGYTAMIDVSAREQGRRTWPASPLTSWLGKSFDTFAPIGPCIATADEIEDPNNLIVRFWNNGQLRHNYNTDDMHIDRRQACTIIRNFNVLHGIDGLRAVAALWVVLFHMLTRAR